MEAVSTEQIDAALKKYHQKRIDHEIAKEEASAKYAAREEAEAELMALLEKAGKEEWRVPGVGLASIATKMSVKTPKTQEDNKLLFDYVVSKHGLEAAMGFFKMHSATLTNFYNTEFEQAEDKSLFDIPGVEAPVANKELRFRKS